jgi:hypothetical protein
MTAVTIGNTAAIPASSAKAPVAGKGFLARALDAFIAARMRQAEREIAAHRHLLPGQLQAVGERLAPRSEKDLPFVR